MLILTRRAGEALRIGDDIEVMVMAVNGSQVRIGINAPREVAVDREEIAERKRRDREGARDRVSTQSSAVTGFKAGIPNPGIGSDKLKAQAPGKRLGLKTDVNGATFKTLS